MRGEVVGVRKFDVPEWWPGRPKPYVIGDSLAILPGLPGDSVDICLTSPP